jgi:hypothetical protein
MKSKKPYRITNKGNRKREKETATKSTNIKRKRREEL